MSTAFGGRGGGGGAFPYRSAHQQGTDGNDRQRQRRRRRNKRTPHSLLCTAAISIPAERRGWLIGKGGATIRGVQECTGATVWVPNRGGSFRGNVDDRRVRVKANNVASLLHACFKIVSLGLKSSVGGEVEIAKCEVQVPSNGPKLEGYLSRQAQFMTGEIMSAYCIESFLDVEEIDTLVDNERFSHPEVTAGCETVYPERDGEPATLVFVYGSPDQHPDRLYNALHDSSTTIWTRECLENISPMKHSEETGSVTVGTYNLLFPAYAEKYRQAAGIDCHGKSNLAIRMSAIVRILLEANLDIYLLQEVQFEALMDVKPPLLTDEYEVIHYKHPQRNANDETHGNDGIALLIRKTGFIIQEQAMVPFLYKEDNSQEYMCAATALIQDTSTQVRYLVVSTHFYTKKALNPQSTLMEYLDSRRGDCDAVIWGGDCNDEYKQGFPKGYRVVDEGHCATRGHKHIDWIFFSPSLKGSRSPRTRAFVDSTMEKLDPTGYPPSDHNGEAITLQFVSEELEH